MSTVDLVPISPLLEPFAADLPINVARRSAEVVVVFPILALDIERPLELLIIDLARFLHLAIERDPDAVSIPAGI